MNDKKSCRFPIRLLFLAALAALGSASLGPACAQAAGATNDAGADTPQATTALYRDWQLHCVVGKDGGKTCEAAGAVLAVDGKGVAARVVVGRPAPSEPIQIVIQLAPGVWLPEGVSLSVPGAKAPLKAEFKQCVQVCFAQTDIDDATVGAMKTSDKPATLAFVDAQRQPVALPLSLAGFKNAMDAGI
ncbi:invasion associated locus B family protein [Pleomorphomonas sp. JP5]|uniref:invasion associated locus B family protein n=1 Tax=Pleomorphomonas sp. JP5 TaxID=2942998 RepID=UPI002044C47A|nr:invasion associated locus B family protein [Pleomorphomonas sp. JP5]MCM5557823.1 invasion associated locus B family protein [Pleomorphomonas sp. JP5]